MHPRHALLLVPLLSFATFACGDGSSKYSTVDARFDASTAGAQVTHAWFPLVPGTTHEYRRDEEARDDERGNRPPTHTTRAVSHFTRTLGGVECCWVVVRERALDERGEPGELVEERFEYFAQDAAGHVWILGVDATQYEEGEVVGRDGSWSIEEDGERAGLVLPHSPRPRDAFERVADGTRVRALVQSNGVRVETPELGTFVGCLQLSESIRGAAGAEDRTVLLAPDLGEVTHRGGGGDSDRQGSRWLRAVLDDKRPALDPNHFRATVDHPYFPLVPGITLRYAGTSEDGFEEVLVSVLADTKRVLGVDCTSVEVLELVEGELVEESIDWYAQDELGNVWYFGSAVTEFEDGVAVGTEGSWIAGENGAQPGLEMPASPRVGDSYRQEYAPGVAEDVALVHRADVDVIAGGFAWSGCLEIRERNPLEPDSASEFKYHARSVGVVLEVNADGSETLELVEISD